MEENNIIDDHPTRPSLPTYAGHPLHFSLVSVSYPSNHPLLLFLSLLGAFLKSAT